MLRAIARRVLIPAVVASAACSSPVIDGESAPAPAEPERASILESNKDAVERLFELANAGNDADAALLVAADYVEHADLPDGRQGFLSVVASNRDVPIVANAEQERHRIRGEVVRMIAEGDHVWVYSQVAGDEARVARMDMFRVDGGTIAEHWAIVEPVVEERNNDNDHFALGRGGQDFREQPTRIATVASAALLEANKDAVRTFYQNRESGDVEALRQVMREDYIQHNPGIADGAAPMLRPRRTSLAPPDGERYCPNEVVRLVAEGDLVWAFIRGGCGAQLQLNQFRIENGQLAEHWGMYQEVPDSKANDNNWFGYGAGPVADFSR